MYQSEIILSNAFSLGNRGTQRGSCGESEIVDLSLTGTRSAFGLPSFLPERAALDKGNGDFFSGISYLPIPSFVILLLEIDNAKSMV